MQAKIARDLLVYLAFCALPIAGFLLAQPLPGYSASDTQFYLGLLVISFVVIVSFVSMYSNEIGEFLKFDNELRGFSLALIAGGVIGCLVFASIIVSHFISPSLVSSIIVPKISLNLSINSVTLPALWGNILYNMTLVAPAEETSKLVTMLGFYLGFKNFLGKSGASVLGTVVPIGVWATLHTYENPAYQGQYAFIMVGTAFIAGLIIYGVMRKTNSLLAAILVHGLYNIVLLFLAQ